MGSFMMIGYARVSAGGQSANAQRAQLVAAGAEKVFYEMASGRKKVERPELRRALRTLSAGDTLLVTSLDRVARSTRVSAAARIRV